MPNAGQPRERDQGPEAYGGVEAAEDLDPLHELTGREAAVDARHQLVPASAGVARVEFGRRDVGESDAALAVESLEHADLAHAERAIPVEEDLEDVRIGHGRGMGTCAAQVNASPAPARPATPAGPRRPSLSLRDPRGRGVTLPAGAFDAMTTSTSPDPSSRLSRAFWMLCTMEMWERLAYYGVRVVAPIYIMQADEPGGLHFSAADKATIYGWWFVVQSILPTFTGGLADRYGYKNTLAFSVTLKVAGYVLMATQRSFWGFFVGTMVLAAGTAQFKPGIQGSIAQHLDHRTGSKGWGIFYWLVNVGAVIGPPFAGWLHGFGWDVVFYGCAATVSLNYLMLFTYEEKRHEKRDVRSPGKVLYDTFRDFLDWRLLVFLLLMSGFWLMMYQLWDLHPNFLTDWVYSESIAETLHLPEAWVDTKNGITQVKQENLLNLNAALIVLFVIPVSALVAQLRTLSAMLGGMVVATLGILVAGVTQVGWIFLLGVAFFSFGEMLTGPKKNQYLAAIAPEDKRGQYLGYVNIPVGFGGLVGSYLAGYLYGNFGEKAILSLRYLAEHTGYLSSRGASWNGEVATLEATFAPFSVSRANAFETLLAELGKSGVEATDVLWTTYQPYEVWYAFAAIGVVSIVGLFFFNRAAKRWSDLNK